MHPDFPKTVLRLTDGKGVVKVLGIARVDGERRHCAHVLAPPDFLRSDARFYLVGFFLHLFRIGIRQPVLCQDGMHLSRVFPALTQDIHDFADGILGRIRPFGDFHHSLIPVLPSMQGSLGNKDVVSQRPVLRNQKGEIFPYFQPADKCLVAPLQDFHHLGFAQMMFPPRQKADLHLVPVHGMQGIALGHKHRFPAFQG